MLEHAFNKNIVQIPKNIKKGKASVLTLFYKISDINQMAINETQSQSMFARTGIAYANRFDVEKNIPIGYWETTVHNNLSANLKYVTGTIWTPKYTIKYILTTYCGSLKLGDTMYGTILAATGEYKNLTSDKYYCGVTNLNGDLHRFIVKPY